MTTQLVSREGIDASVEVITVGTASDGESILDDAVAFLQYQVRMITAITRRHEGVALFFSPTAYLLPVTVARHVGKTVILEPPGAIPLSLFARW